MLRKITEIKKIIQTVDVAKYKFNISPRNNILKIKEKSIEFINNFDNENYKNLLFTGNAGLRKNIYV